MCFFRVLHTHTRRKEREKRRGGDGLNPSESLKYAPCIHSRSRNTCYTLQHRRCLVNGLCWKSWMVINGIIAWFAISFNKTTCAHVALSLTPCVFVFLLAKRNHLSSPKRFSGATQFLVGQNKTLESFNLEREANVSYRKKHWRNDWVRAVIHFRSLTINRTD